MAITAAQDDLIHFVSEVRMYLRDFAELNRLIDGEETSDRMIAWAVIDTLDDINNTPPFIGAYTCSSFPYRSLLLRGTVVSILESVGLLQTRNQLNYSDGGIQVGVSDKAPMLMQWINMLKSSYEQKLAKWKISQNITQAFEGDSVMSDYYFLGGYYDVFDRVYR
tara:strand:- start:144 stop:638 length:495 start_codon:yes stop_codon:yes gene_type:complete